MKIAKKDLALIMVIVGILAAFCSYKFYFSGKMEEVEKENKAQAELQDKIDAVKAVADTVPDMKKEMELWQNDVTNLLAKFKVNAIYEDGILYAKAIETDLGAEIGSYNIAQSSEVARVPGEGKFSGKTYVKGTTNYSISYHVADYDALKKLINYLVSGNAGVKTLDSMSFIINDDNSISGSVNLTVFVMSDGSVEYQAPTINGVETGKIPNIFGTPVENEKEKDK